MHVVERDDEDSSAGYELTHMLPRKNERNLRLKEGDSDETEEEEEEPIGGVIRDDTELIQPHGPPFWRVDQRICYAIVVSMVFSTITTVYLATIVFNVLGVMFLSAPLSLLALVDTLLGTYLVFTLLYLLGDDKLKRRVAASRLFVLIFGAVMCIAVIVETTRAHKYFLIEPDGRHVPGTDSLRGKLAIFTTLCAVTAASRIVDAFMSATFLGCSFENVQWYSLLPLPFTSSCNRTTTTRKLATPLGSKVCIFSCFATLVVSVFFVGICSWSVLNNLVIDHSTTTVYGNCDPLVTASCSLPWPNDFFTEPCNTSKTGLKLAVHPDVLPVTRGGIHIGPTSLNKLDGFSTAAPILFHMEGLSMHGFPSPQNIEDSVNRSAFSASWLLSASTGEPVPHFVQLDVNEPEVPFAVLQSAVPLAHGTRYVVGIVGARHAVSGDYLEPTPGFSALLDAAYNDSETENARAKRFKKEVFPIFKKVGISPSSLQLAFDFTTISEDAQLGLFKNMRSHEMEEHFHPKVKVLNSNEDSNGFRTVWATIPVPAYVDYSSREGLLSPCGQRLMEGYESGIQCELVEEGVLLRIPPNVTSGNLPLTTLVQYGHSLFNSRAEILEPENQFLDNMSNDNGWIVAAADWKGMSHADSLNVAHLLLDSNIVSSFENVIHNLGQAFVVGDLLMSHLRENWMVYAGPNAHLLDGKKVPASSFYGISEGGILGAAYTVFNDAFSSSVLSVSGSPFALLLPRSKYWYAYLKILKMNLVNAIDIQLLLVLWQSHWDAAEAGGWLAAPKEKEFATRVLIQEGLRDAEVSNLGSMILARAFNAVAVIPLNQSMFGIPVANSSSAGQYCLGNVIEVYNYSHVWPTNTNFSIIHGVKDTGVHQMVRHDPMAQKDVINFISNGCV